jgi:HEAT repeat protein
MNKFQDSQCPDYKKVVGKIQEIIGKIRAGTPLKQADKHLRDKHYTADRLRIERLSGESLSMDQCYINLTIVEQSGQETSHSENVGNSAASPFSIFVRQKVEATDKTMQVELAAIFNERNESDGRSMQPRRILIRGRAGVGKTTLCKKIVYEFIRGTLGKWNELFDRVLWVPLRNLKLPERRNTPRYTFEDLFSHEFLLPTYLAGALSRALATNSSKTLFLLDGLDEVSQDLTGDSGMARFLAELLSQPNVVVTSRPSAKSPSNLHLELETIGFEPDQVNDYIERSFTNPKTAEIDQARVDKVKSFLQERWVIQGLVRIPVQLDALCYTWDDLRPENIPNTMTGMYEEIELKLWKRKDIFRLEKKYNSNELKMEFLKTAGRRKIERFVKDEMAFIESLAFTGLHNEVINFTSEELDIISDHFTPSILPDQILPSLSFLRASDPSLEYRNRNYYFIHLTFQEYFAARYFVRQWKLNGELQILTFDNKDLDIGVSRPAQFLRKHKYTARYDIFWRFVTGLLDGSGQASDFICTIEEEPLDLLGPAHQRLVMHCLSEISSNLPMREALEKRLAQWLLFECTFNRSARLASEGEFPELALKISLLEGSSDAQAIIMQSLANRASIPQSIIEHVAAQLDDMAFSVRNAAVEALSGRAALPEGVLLALAARLDDNEQGTRRAAVEVLGRRAALPDDVLRAIAARLNHKDRGVQIAAIKAIRRAALSNVVLRTVAARIDDKDRDVRRAAVEALGGRAGLPKEVLLAVAARVDDEEPAVRRAAVEVLGGLAPLSEELLMAVAARLDDEDWNIQNAAVRALHRWAALPGEVLTAMVARLDDENLDVRRVAIKVLGGLASVPDEVLTSLATLLDDADSIVRFDAVQALGERATLPDEIVTAVALRLDDKDSYVRMAAVDALLRQVALPKEALWAVAVRLDDEIPFVRRYAVKALGEWATLPDEIVMAVARRLDDKDSYVREAAVHALGCQVALPNEVLWAVVVRLDDEETLVRFAAIQALSWRMALPFDVVTAVAARLDDEDEGVQRAAVYFLMSKHENFHFNLYTELHVASVYKGLLGRSFTEQLSWCVEKSYSGINMPDGIKTVSIDAQPNDVREWINGARPANYPTANAANS